MLNRKMLSKALFAFVLILSHTLVYQADVNAQRINAAEEDWGKDHYVTLVVKAWKAYDDKDIDAVNLYCDRSLELWGDAARTMQQSLTAYPGSKIGEEQTRKKIDEIWQYRLLNDVGSCLYIKGKLYEELGRLEESKKAFLKLINEFYYAHTWSSSGGDTSEGFFWRTADNAEASLLRNKTVNANDELFGENIKIIDHSNGKRYVLLPIPGRKYVISNNGVRTIMVSENVNAPEHQGFDIIENKGNKGEKG